MRSKIIGNELNRPLANSRPPRSDPLPAVTTDILQLFPKRKPMRRCGQRTCTVRPRLIVVNSIHQKLLNYNVRIPDHFPALTCTSKNIVYIVKCKVHHKAYVGQTINMVRT